jgi:uncharacterized membrane protein YgaE (UPF0421/DUF939 family)
MKIKQADLIIYIIKCVLGTIIGFTLYRHYPQVGQWCLLSIILVLAPDRKDAFMLATNRIKANLVGSGIGLILFLVHSINIVMICIGVIVAIVVCELLSLQVATRTAVVALLIVTMHEKGQYLWDVALERAMGVVGGCIIGVLITYAFHIAIFKYRRKLGSKALI